MVDDACLRVVPLGGLGEVGGNALLLEHPSGSLLIDCGLLFPRYDEPGIDYLIPDLSYLRRLSGPLVAAIATHAHEDHIGAFGHLLREHDVPVYASRLTHAFLAARLRDAELAARLVEVSDGEERRIGPYTVGFLPVTHSVPQAFALTIDTPVGLLVHSGDYRIDPRPPDGRAMALDALAAVGRRGVTLLLADSTNALTPGHTRPEDEVAATFKERFAAARGRVIVTTFASHLHRLQAAIEASRLAGRRVMLVGRAVREAVAIGLAHGQIHASEGLFAQVHEFCQLEPRQLTIIASGSQGEASSAMTRIALGEHPDVVLGPSDLAIISARRIPGNETAVDRVVNALARTGVTVLTDAEPGIHASGHACQDEQRHLLALTRPRLFTPVHGEYRQLYAHAALAEQAGVAGIHVLEDGLPLELRRVGDEVHARLGEIVPHGFLCVDGKGVGDVAEHVLRDRRELAERGVSFCSLVFSHAHQLVAPPLVVTRGVIHVDAHPELQVQAQAEVLDAVTRLPTLSRADDETVQEVGRKALRRFWKHALGRHPMILVTVHRLERPGHEAA